MTSILAASTSLAAATLLSATAFVGSEALASEPLRLNDAQMDTVTAGSVSVSAQSSASVKGGEGSTRATVIIKRNGKTIYRKDVVDGVERRDKRFDTFDDVEDVEKRFAKLRERLLARAAEHHERLAALKEHFRRR